MASPVHMTVEGISQGLITEAACTMTGREDTELIYSLEHVVEAPRDPHTGRSTGKRVHRPVVIVKEIGLTSPLFFKALVTNELLTVSFQWYRPNPSGDGTDEQFYTVKLERANLVNFKNLLAHTHAAQGEHTPPLEELQFSYEKITVTYEPGGKVGSDDWRAPV